MPFFLLKRDDNDGLRLLTPTALPGRQEALAELSRMTSEPGFDAWDGEVLLVDIDAALPVLLVRPAESEAAAGGEVIAVQVDEPMSVAEPVTEVAFAWPLIAETEPEVAAPLLAPEPEPVPAEEAEAFAAYVAPAAEAEDSTSVAVLADEDASVADTFYPVPEMAMELEPEPSPVPDAVVPSAGVDSVDVFEAPAPVVSASASPDEPAEADDALDDGGLREALERTASAMAAEAVVARTQAEAPEEPKPPRRARLGHKWPWDVAPTPVDDVAVAAVAAVAATVEEPSVADVPAHEMVVAPLGAAAPVEDTVAEVLPTAASADDAVLAPPIGATALEEVAEAQVAGAPIVEEDTEPLDDEVRREETLEIAAVIDASPVEAIEPPTAPSEAEVGPTSQSEFLSDLEPIPAQRDPGSPATVPVAMPDAPAPEQDPVEPSSLDDYVCADCVYEATCPSKDQRLPKDCVSFQWK
jgi:nicotinate-nucleotide--dimethylbenzimidazole phosphoribosyltransferase